MQKKRSLSRQLVAQ